MKKIILVVFLIVLFQDDVKFRNRMRKLKIKLLDNSIKSVLVDESLPVEMLMPSICEKIGKCTVGWQCGRLSRNF